MSLRGRRHGGGRKNELVFITTCGPTTTFDPKITGVGGGVWYFDDGTTLAAASGVEISKTFATEGLHRAVFRPASGGLAAITAMVCNSDAITAIHSLRRLPNLSILAPHTNPSLSVNIADVPNATSINLSGGTLAMGNINSLNRRLTYFAGTASPGLYGCVSDFPVTVETIVVSLSAGVLAGSISHLVALRDAQANSVGWLTADVDTVIDSMWAARANYTYATPALQIGGTNQAPSGNVIAPIEGADWHQDGATWIPLTTGAKAYDLAKNVNSETRTALWSITYTGGSITP